MSAMKNIRSKNKDPKDKIDPKPWIIGAACILAFVGIVFLYDALSKYLPIVSLKQQADGTLYDSKLDITYTPAPDAYKAVMVITDPQYARVKKLAVYGIGYRNTDEKIVELDTTRYLSTNNDNDAVLYYNAADVKLPTLDEWDYEKSYVCSTDGVIFARAELDKTETSKMLKGFKEGAPTSILGKVKERYTIRITSGTHDWLYYCMSFTITEDGNYYITDTISKKTVLADKDLFDQFFGNVQK